ncbi:uncharacterized protein LOC142357332, partial [Convolutriloba macropyga]|uniref:uncharacterized protein LOC142357332 n=1 Tax=Convolutriloba macropyga TaxID=536237 RepID=UPI003F522A90
FPTSVGSFKSDSSYVAKRPGTAFTGYGIKWAFQGYLAQFSSINLTNILKAPYLNLSYDVEVWLTGDSFGDSPDLYINDTIDGVAQTNVPVYHYKKRVFVHEGFDHVNVSFLTKFRRYVEVNKDYEIRVDVDNIKAYKFGLLISITWGEMDGSGDIENQALTSKSDYKHNYQAEGNNTVCVKAQNKVSHDEECWYVVVLNPVDARHLRVDWSNVDIGCPCGEEPWLGNKD